MSSMGVWCVRVCVCAYIYSVWWNFDVCHLQSRVSCTDAPSNNSNTKTLFGTISFSLRRSILLWSCGSGGTVKGWCWCKNSRSAGISSPHCKNFIHYWLHIAFEHFKYSEWKYEFMKSASVWSWYDRTQKGFRFILTHKNRNNIIFCVWHCKEYCGEWASTCVLNSSVFWVLFFWEKGNVRKTHCEWLKSKKKKNYRKRKQKQGTECTHEIVQFEV